jgi:tetratricopeptide (TPR) repeat protein
MSKEQQGQIYLDALAKSQKKDYKAALEILEKKIRKIDRGYFYYFYHGFFTQEQNFEKYSSVALSDYLKAYKINPNTYDINSSIGFVYIVLKEYEQAIPYLERANELYSPESGAPPPYWDLAEAYLHVGRLEDAFEMNTKAIEESEYSWQYLQRGIILSQSGDLQALRGNYEIAKKIEPDNLSLHRGYALRLVEMGYTEEAYQLYSDWIKGNESYYDWCYADMGYILMLNGNWDKSIEFLKKAETINNNDILTLQYLSFYYFFNGDYDAAYEYEAKARLQNEPSGITHWKKTTDEFIEGYKNNWQFQKLLQLHQ